MKFSYSDTAKLDDKAREATRKLISLLYHDVFDYPLTKSELLKWSPSKKINGLISKDHFISYKGGFYYLEDKKNLVIKRLLREKICQRKLKVAQRGGKILALIPTIKMIGITGALAMKNSDDESDIDLIIITKRGTLWISRLLSLFFLDLIRIPRRKFGDRNQKDKLCLNMWLEEGDLVWPKKTRNIYSAHEIAQIVPILSKEKTYEKFIWENRWITEFWPNAVSVTKELKNKRNEEQKEFLISLVLNFFSSLVEILAFKFQYNYMRNKITRETVTPTRALFHPVDWASVVLSRFQNII